MDSRTTQGMKDDDDDFEMRKSSTMNSMYIGSTISKPNVESIINAVATILHSQMLEVGNLKANGSQTRPNFLLRQ